MQSSLSGLGDIMGPDVPSPSNMWALTFYLGSCLELRGCQWVPIENKPFEAETATAVDPTGKEITATYPWFDSMRDLCTASLEPDEDSLFWRISNVYVAKWDDKLKKFRYSMRYIDPISTDQQFSLLESCFFYSFIS